MKFLVAAASITVSIASLFYINSSMQELHEASYEPPSRIEQTALDIQCGYYNRTTGTLGGEVPQTEEDIATADICDRTMRGFTP